jgi:GTP-binding protein
MSATNGQPGQGTWRHGKRGEDLIIEVPYGTVIREQRGYSVTEEEKEQEILSESLQDFRRRLKKEAREEDDEDLIARRRKLFVLYPSSTDENAVLTNKQVNDLEMSLLEEERRQAYKRLTAPPLEMDFDKKPANVELELELNNKGNDKAIDTISEKMLLLKGGQGGYGNPYFTSTLLRTPKFATRGRPGESMRLEFELKTLADVGLVGLPNAGKRCA